MEGYLAARNVLKFVFVYILYDTNCNEYQQRISQTRMLNYIKKRFWNTDGISRVKEDAHGELETNFSFFDSVHCIFH